MQGLALELLSVGRNECITMRMSFNKLSCHFHLTLICSISKYLLTISSVRRKEEAFLPIMMPREFMSAGSIGIRFSSYWQPAICAGYIKLAANLQASSANSTTFTRLFSFRSRSLILRSEEHTSEL